ncbi:MAG TPA: hypothetical protein VGQ21_18445 [Thermoanaerobaculia bacterium]|jgi:hypothetical protein|nr:hypothetical protein [Thermoanaerobaculia bacterium]
MTPIIEAFGNGLFGTNDPATNDQQLSELQTSAFNSIILWSVHVQPNGDLTYNDTPLVTGGTFNADLNYMTPYVAALRQQGEVWWGVGSYGATDFQNLGALLSTPAGTATVTQTFAALFDAIPAEGVDFDMEESYGPDMQNTIVQFTLLLAQSLNLKSTYCPYMFENFWLGCLADVYASAGQQYVQRFNLQCYAGGTGNTTASWLSALQTYGRPLGIPDVNAFILPSNWVQSDDGTQKYTPAQTCAFFSDPNMRQNAGGAFLWNTSEIFSSGYTATDYATALANGLADQC